MVSSTGTLFKVPYIKKLWQITAILQVFLPIFVEVIALLMISQLPVAM